MDNHPSGTGLPEGWGLAGSGNSATTAKQL
jgi:hypothetical protein